LIEYVTPYLPHVVAAGAFIAAVAALGKGAYGAAHAVGRRRASRVVAIVTPLIDTRLAEVDTALLQLRLEQQETRQVVDQVKRLVSNGLQEDVKEIRKQQSGMSKRIDAIYDHLVD